MTPPFSVGPRKANTSLALLISTSEVFGAVTKD